MQLNSVKFDAKLNFLLFLQAVAVSRLGSQLSYTALTLWAAYRFESGLYAGLLTAVPMLTGLVTGVVAGPYLDRISSRTVMITADIVNASAALLISVCLFAETKDGMSLFFPLVLGLRVLGSMATSVFEPSSQVLLPQIVEKQGLLKANSTLAAMKNGSGLLGESISGILFKSLGASGLYLLDGISYLISAALLPFLKLHKQGIKKTRHLPVGELLPEIKEGWIYILRNSGLKRVIILAISLNFVIQPIGLILAFFAKNTLSLGSEWYGIFLATFTMSNLFSSFMASSWVGFFQNKKLLIGTHLLGIGFGQLILFLFPHWLTTVFALMILGLAQGPLNVLILTAIQTNTPQKIQGRIHSTLLALFGSTAPLGTLIAGIAIDQLNEFLHFWFLGGFIICFVLAIFAFQSKKLSRYLLPNP